MTALQETGQPTEYQVWQQGMEALSVGPNPGDVIFFDPKELTVNIEKSSLLDTEKQRLTEALRVWENKRAKGGQQQLKAERRLVHLLGLDSSTEHIQQSTSSQQRLVSIQQEPAMEDTDLSIPVEIGAGAIGLAGILSYEARRQKKLNHPKLAKALSWLTVISLIGGPVAAVEAISLSGCSSGKSPERPAATAPAPATEKPTELSVLSEFNPESANMLNQIINFMRGSFPEITRFNVVSYPTEEREIIESFHSQDGETHFVFAEGENDDRKRTPFLITFNDENDLQRADEITFAWVRNETGTDYNLEGRNRDGELLIRSEGSLASSSLLILNLSGSFEEMFPDFSFSTPKPVPNKVTCENGTITFSHNDGGKPGLAMILASIPVKPENTPTPKPTATPEPTPGLEVRLPDLNVRQGPGTAYDVNNNLPEGAKVQVTGQSNGWYEISWTDDEGNKHQGWVSGSEKYVLANQGALDIPIVPEEELPPTPTPAPTIPPTEPPTTEPTEPTPSPEATATNTPEQPAPPEPSGGNFYGYKYAGLGGVCLLTSRGINFANSMAEPGKNAWATPLGIWLQQNSYPMIGEGDAARPGFAAFFNMTAGEALSKMPSTAKVFAISDNRNGPRYLEFEIDKSILSQAPDGLVQVVYRWDHETNSLTDEIVAVRIALTDGPEACH